MTKGPRAGGAERRREVRKGQGRGGGRGGGGRRPSVQRPRQRALVGSRLEGCGQTSARTGPPPVIAPFSPASTRQPGNQEQGGRQVVGQGALESDGSEGALERFLALVPVSPGLPFWGSHPPLPHGPPAEEESWSRVTGAPTPCYDGQPGLGPSLLKPSVLSLWQQVRGSNPMLRRSAWPRPFPVRKPSVLSLWQQVQSWACRPPFPETAVSQQQGLDPFWPFCLLDPPLFLAPTILLNPLHAPPTSLSCPGWSPPAWPLGDAP